MYTISNQKMALIGLLNNDSFVIMLRGILSFGQNFGIPTIVASTHHVSSMY